MKNNKVMARKIMEILAVAVTMLIMVKPCLSQVDQGPIPPMRPLALTATTARDRALIILRCAITPDATMTFSQESGPFFLTPMRCHIEKRTSSTDNFVVSEWNWPNFNPANIMIRTSKWKLMMPYDKNSTSPNALFNLKDDPYEMNNLIGSNPARHKYKKHTEILRSKLIAWCKKNKSSAYRGY